MSRYRELALNFRIAFRPRKPLLTARLARAVARAWVARRPSLRYVDFAIDFACNLRCEHCFATVLEHPGERRMETEDYARVAREAMRLGAVNFSFQGGEPLAIKRLDDIIRACRPSLNLISVTTNGTLLNPTTVQRLKRLGVDILTVSLDSAIAAEHDAFRGLPGTFDKALAGIRLARQNGLSVNLGTVVTHQTLHSEGILGLVQMAQDMKLLLYIILPVPAGNWQDNRDMVLTDEDIAFIDDLTRRSPYIRTDFQANLGPHGCGAAKEILYLTPYGEVLTCPFLHISFGNIFTDSLETIRNRALELPWFNHYHDKCLASTDPEFIEQHLSATFGAERLPISWQTAFPAEASR